MHFWIMRRSLSKSVRQIRPAATLSAFAMQKRFIRVVQRMFEMERNGLRQQRSDERIATGPCGRTM